MFRRVAAALLILGTTISACRNSSSTDDHKVASSLQAAPLPRRPLDAGETDARVEKIMSEVNLTSPRSVEDAESLLVALGPSAIPDLVAQLRVVAPKPEGGIDRRYLCVRALRMYGARASAAIPFLIPLLGNSAREIDQPQPPGSNIKVAIIEGSELRNASAETLGSIGADALPALTAVLRGSDPIAREKAVYAFALMPPGALEDLDASIADALVDALMAALPAMHDQLDRGRAIEAIPRLPPPSRARAIAPLKALAASADQYVAPIARRVADKLASGR